MEKRVLREEIVKMHLLQQVERKKALLVQLMLSEGGSSKEIPGELEDVITDDDVRQYDVAGNLHLANGVFPKQFALPNYFRGENAYYPNSKSTVYRDVSKGMDVNAKLELKEKIQAAVSADSGKAERETLTVIPEVIEAHYGFPSEWIGFTSDFDEALFYACCIYDPQNGTWRPLQEPDFTEPAYEGDADRRYGVIYMAEASDPRFQGAFAGGEYDVMIPAGSQPLMQNIAQYAYAMRLRSEDDLAKDARFDRLVFEHSAEMCRDIYERMNGGKYLYK